MKKAAFNWLGGLLMLGFLAGCSNLATSTPTATAVPASQTPVAESETAVLPIATPSPGPSATPPPLAPLPESTATSTAVPQPQLRAGQWTSLVYHEGLGQVILVNGGPESGKPANEPLELWGWDGAAWTLLSADVDGPRWRNWAGVAYDNARDVLVIQGGLQNRTVRFEETWEWDGQTWTRFEGAGPGVREGARMVYDAARDQIIYFGGAVEMDIRGDTWAWDGREWTQIDASGPSPRFPADMVYDAAQQQVLLYGGHYIDANGGVENFADLWVWDGTWQEQTFTEPAPGIRALTDLVFNPQTRQILLISGGFDQFSEDTWAWDGEQWTLLAAEGAPTRSGHTAVYDEARDKVVLFGGVDRPGGVALADTWEWDGQAWTCVDGCSEVAETPTAVAATDVFLYRADAQRSGAYDFPAFRELPDVAWQKQIGPSSLGSPVLADEVLYVGAQDGRLYALNAQTGSELWAATGFGGHVSPVAVAGNLVYASGLTGQLQALDRETGGNVWSFAANGTIWGAPLVVGEVVYVAAEQATYALNAGNGELLWQYDTGPHQGFMGGPAFSEDTVYVTVGSHLYALDGTTGDLRWQQESLYFYGTAVGHGLVFVGSDDRHLYAFDQQSGEEVWRFQAEGEGWSAPVIAGDVVYVGNKDQHIYALDAATGAALWQFMAEDWAVSDPIWSDGVLYVGVGNHDRREGPRSLYTLEATSGELLWQYQADGRLLTAPAIGEGVLAIVTLPGEITALRPPP